ncbi:transglycosylase SLT domain-containing protein [Basilea psittacipulmonis]|uniref:Lipoprotein n=1 Tax=Basilea psittacipulmonis DSM 24701 TaxID=1072685 RepID=A0A077DE59_9BURK|nr:lipoprotein [Basilea psittacipulmonis]AIL32964.1 lipoprotein [Basilea psittacipulmonis DSM 24701]
MTRRFKYISAISLLTSVLVGCAGTPKGPPKNPENLCDIFKEFPSWYQAAKLSQDRWGTPMHVSMSIMYQESSYRHNAKPPMKYFLWVIPVGRGSSAYGYSQAQDDSWREYENAMNKSRDREEFTHAIDFIAWYVNRNYARNKVSKWDAYKQYLAYHEGMGGYARGTYRQKQWLLNIAKRVDQRAKQYGAQLRQCNHIK